MNLIDNNVQENVNPETTPAVDENNEEAVREKTPAEMIIRITQTGTSLKLEIDKVELDAEDTLKIAADLLPNLAINLFESLSKAFTEGNEDKAKDIVGMYLTMTALKMVKASKALADGKDSLLDVSDNIF